MSAEPTQPSTERPPDAGAADAPAAAAATRIDVRVEPTGPSAERAIALACAPGTLRRDGDAPLGRPAAIGKCADGEAALAQLVHAAALALDDTDLHLTVRRR